MNHQTTYRQAKAYEDHPELHTVEFDDWLLERDACALKVQSTPEDKPTLQIWIFSSSGAQLHYNHITPSEPEKGCFRIQLTPALQTVQNNIGLTSFIP